MDKLALKYVFLLYTLSRHTISIIYSTLSSLVLISTFFIYSQTYIIRNLFDEIFQTKKIFIRNNKHQRKNKKLFFFLQPLVIDETLHDTLFPSK